MCKWSTINYYSQGQFTPVTNMGNPKYLNVCMPGHGLMEHTMNLSFEYWEAVVMWSQSSLEESISIQNKMLWSNSSCYES